MGRQQQEEEIYNEQKFEIKKPKFTFASFLEKNERKVKEAKKKFGGKKVDYRFQEIGLQLQEFFGKNIWFLFYKYNLDKIKAAFEICKKKNNKEIRYLIGIIKKL